MSVDKKRISKYLDSLIKDQTKKMRANEAINNYISLIRKGYSYDQLRNNSQLSSLESSILFEIASSRIAISRKFKNWQNLWVDRYLSRYTTPEVIANYRINRLKDYEILDIGAGSGIQDLIFSDAGIKTVGIEKDPVRYRLCLLNAQEYKDNQVRFIHGDAYDLNLKEVAEENTVIFSDPSRPESEIARNLESLLPSPLVLYRILKDISPNFAFDLPPQIRSEKVSLDGETEYLSISGSLNRLTLYTGALSKSKSSAVMLPSGMRISGDPERFREQSGKLGNYILVPDISLVYAGLLWKLNKLYPLTFVYMDKKRALFSSDQRLSNFFGEQYEVVEMVNDPFNVEAYRKHDVAKVYLRYEIQDKDYYTVKNRIEKELNGTKDAYIFKIDENYIITFKVSNS